MLKDHYLQSDLELTSDHLMELLKIPSNICECAIRGDFIHMDNMLRDYENSINVLRVLNEKKLKADKEYMNMNVRYSW